LGAQTRPLGVNPVSGADGHPGVQARSHPATDPRKERQRRCRRYAPACAHPTANPGRAPGAARERTLKSGGPQRRSPCARRGGLARPCGPPSSRSCSLPVPHGWRTWCSLSDPATSRHRAGAPKVHPAMGANCTRENWETQGQRGATPGRAGLPHNAEAALGAEADSRTPPGPPRTPPSFPALGVPESTVIYLGSRRTWRADEPAEIPPKQAMAPETVSRAPPGSWPRPIGR
jgi:hypothetical protein